MIIGSFQKLMFPHPLGFLGDIYKTFREFIALQLEEKKKTRTKAKYQTGPNSTIAGYRLILVPPFWKYRYTFGLH